MNSVICDAIHKRQLIELTYGWGLRVVEPHAYGRNDNGHDLLSCYQISGASQSGKRRGWKLLKLNEVGSLRVLPDTFNTRHGYKRGDKAMDAKIYCQI